MRYVWLLIDNGPIGEVAKVEHPIAACETESVAKAVAAWRFDVSKRLTTVREIAVVGVEEP
jgi:hypothetical protein